MPGCVLPARGTSISLCWHQSHCQRCPSVATSAPSPPPPGPACPWWPEPQGATRVSPCLLCPEGLQAGTGGPMAPRLALDTPMAPRWLQVPYGQPCSPAAHTAPCPPVCCDPPFAMPYILPTPSCASHGSYCIPNPLLCPTEVPMCTLPFAVPHKGSLLPASSCVPHGPHCVSIPSPCPAWCPHAFAVTHTGPTACSDSHCVPRGPQKCAHPLLCRAWVLLYAL